MNRIQITGMIVSKMFNERTPDNVLNLLVTDVVGIERITFQVPIWGEKAVSLNNLLNKGDQVTINGYISSINVKSGKSPLIVVKGPEVIQAAVLKNLELNA